MPWPLFPAKKSRKSCLVNKNSVIMGLAGAFFCHLLSGGEPLASELWSKAMLGYAFGFAVGSMNLVLLIVAVIKGIRLGAEDAAQFVSRRFPFRYLLTALFTGLVLWKVPVNPVAFVAGISVTLFATIGTFIYLSRGDIAPLSTTLRETR